jgi:hypothetical protein
MLPKQLEEAQVHQGDERHPLYATIARQTWRASDGGSEGMASPSLIQDKTSRSTELARVMKA